METNPTITTGTRVTTAIVKGTSYLFYISIGAFVTFLIMLGVHYYITPFLPYLPSSSSSKDSGSTPTYDTLTIYHNSLTPAPSDTLLTELAPLLLGKTDNFTLSFDCFLNGTYLSTVVPRVLFYFGSPTAAVTIANNNELKEYKDTDTEKETPKLLNATNSDLINKFPNTNFIVYIDPVKNDLKVGVYTIGTATPYTVRLEIASIIKNIPIKQAFKVTIVLTSKFIEVYMDKKLVNTHKIGSLSGSNVQLNTVNANYGIYTPIRFIGNTVRVGNIQFFNGPLTSSQIRSLITPVLTNTFFNKI